MGACDWCISLVSDNLSAVRFRGVAMIPRKLFGKLDMFYLSPDNFGMNQLIFTRLRGKHYMFIGFMHTKLLVICINH